MGKDGSPSGLSACAGYMEEKAFQRWLPEGRAQLNYLLVPKMSFLSLTPLSVDQKIDLLFF